VAEKSFDYVGYYLRNQTSKVFRSTNWDSAHFSRSWVSSETFWAGIMDVTLKAAYVELADLESSDHIDGGGGHSVC
jgi:hypothetical protein